MQNEIKSLLVKEQADSEDLVKLFFLALFPPIVPSGAKIAGRIAQKRRIKRGDFRIMLIAKQLHCGASRGQFLSDLEVITSVNTRGLLMENVVRRLAATFDREIEIRERRKEFLESARAGLYPSYFDGILDRGFLYLYDYLLTQLESGEPEQGVAENCEVRRPGSIKKINEFKAVPFSRITLDVRHAIVNHVKGLVKSSQQDVVFLVGNTGVGKSTTLAFLRGDPLIRTEDNKYRTPVDTIIGESRESHTLLPNVYVTEEKVYVDFPGFTDVRGDPLRLGIELAFKALVSFYKPKVILVSSIQALESEKGTQLRDLGDALRRMLGRGDLCPVFITQYLRLSEFSELNMLKQRKRELVQKAQERTETNQQKIRKYEQKIAELSEEIQELEEERAEAPLKPREEKRLASDRRKVLQNREKLESLCRGGDLRASELAACEELIQKKREKINKQNRELLDMLEIKNGNHPIAELAELEDPVTREVCSAVINQTQPINAISSALPSSYTADLIKIFKEAFAGGLLPAPPKMEVDELRHQTLETSLIGLLTAENFPEIGDFLHLPEMESDCIEEIDKAMVVDFTDNLIRLIVMGSLKNDEKNDGKTDPITHWISKNITSLRKTHERGADLLNEEWKRLRDKVVAISTTGAKTWETLQGVYQSRTDLLLGKLDANRRACLKEWDHWAANFFHLPGWIQIPKFLYTGRANKSANDKLIIEVKSLINELNFSFEKLKELQMIITNKKDIDNCWKACEMALHNPDSFSEKINLAVRKTEEIYNKNAKEDTWDSRLKRVATSLLNKLSRYFSDLPDFLDLLKENPFLIDLMMLELCSQGQSNDGFIAQVAKCSKALSHKVGASGNTSEVSLKASLVVDSLINRRYLFSPIPDYQKMREVKNLLGLTKELLMLDPPSHGIREVTPEEKITGWIADIFDLFRPSPCVRLRKASIIISKELRSETTKVTKSELDRLQIKNIINSSLVVAQNIRIAEFSLLGLIDTEFLLLGLTDTDPKTLQKRIGEINNGLASKLGLDLKIKLHKILALAFLSKEKAKARSPAY